MLLLPPPPCCLAVIATTTFVQIIEDKTFGLKNKKKSSKVQKYIKTVKQQVKGEDNPKFRRQQAAVRCCISHPPFPAHACLSGAHTPF